MEEDRQRCFMLLMLQSTDDGWVAREGRKQHVLALYCDGAQACTLAQVTWQLVSMVRRLLPPRLMNAVPIQR